MDRDDGRAGIGATRRERGGPAERRDELGGLRAARGPQARRRGLGPHRGAAPAHEQQRRGRVGEQALEEADGGAVVADLVQPGAGQTEVGESHACTLCRPLAPTVVACLHLPSPPATRGPPRGAAPPGGAGTRRRSPRCWWRPCRAPCRSRWRGPRADATTSTSPSSTTPTPGCGSCWPRAPRRRAPGSRPRPRPSACSRACCRSTCPARGPTSGCPRAAGPSCSPPPAADRSTSSGSPPPPGCAAPSGAAWPRCTT